jgi:hypothetical protein
MQTDYKPLTRKTATYAVEDIAACGSDQEKRDYLTEKLHITFIRGIADGDHNNEWERTEIAKIILSAHAD